MTEGTACKTGLGGDAIGAQFATLSGLAFFVLKLTGLLRISEEVEAVGIDTQSHSPPKAYAMQ